MKPYCFLIIVIISSSLNSCAQTKLAEGLVKGKTETFSAEKSKIAFNNKRSLFVIPQKNKHKGFLPGPKDNYDIKILKSDFHVDTVLVKNIVNNVLKDKITSLHLTKETLRMLLIFETNGTLTDITYTVNENTIISPQEIEMIDDALRKNVKASFTGSDYVHYVVASYSCPVINF